MIITLVNRHCARNAKAIFRSSRKIAENTKRSVRPTAAVGSAGGLAPTNYRHNPEGEKAARRVLLLLLAVVSLAGCTLTPGDNGATGNDTVSVSLFQQGKGVLFSDETVKLFGVEIVEAVERPMQRRVEKTARVYRAARENTPGRALVLLSRDEAKELKPGQSLRLRDSSGEGLEVQGQLVGLDRQALAALGQIEGLIEFADPTQHFPAEAVVKATFTNGETKPVLVVPESALLVAADGSYVYTVNGTHLTRTRIKAGATREGVVEIEDGLYAGDSVAAKGVENLWLVELSALKGGTPCCAAPKKNADK